MLLSQGTYGIRRSRSRLDVSVLLGITIVLLYVLPGTLIVPNLTYAGRPALLLALLLFAWWCLVRLNPRLLLVGPQPIRWVLGIYLIAHLMSYLAGLLRGLPTQEANAQDFATLQLLEFLGVALIAADGIRNWDRLNRVLQVAVWCTGFMAIVGIIQAVFKYDVSTHLVIPGLEVKGGLAGFGQRGDEGQFRVAGTTVHYIEYSAVMAMMVPFAIHVARFAPRRGHRQLAAVSAMLAAVANPMSISRTGIVALGLALLVMLPVWSWRLRYTFLFLGAGAVMAIMFLKPGVLGTLKSMFLNVGVDPSIEGRTNDYELVGHFFDQRPWLGRGPRTLLADPVRDTILDNQWLYTLVTGGVIGVLALLAVHVVSIALAVIAFRRATREEDRHLCVALISAQVVAVVVGGTFDSLYYTTFAISVALFVGLSGAVWRLTHPARIIRTSTVQGLD
ncbi:O-Antigen ligase [Micromonospora phaseoli]|uniref:O-Antigen ligase n=1 Tax=Micromonospora phaseoli TaxID=1144548 RepID=A0A1H6T141_9ACTN|nr:O-antigen ligase family protein [Micromonospora phaseoli]PZW04189.1 O-antigen ligase-like membrane protein [Micromonospora phaseoli]SEI73798.1 O-Antigen ligase [Micromonospora phaseoli]